MNVKHLPPRLIFVLAVLSSFCLGRPTLAQPVYENYTFLTIAGPGMAGPGFFDGLGDSARFGKPAGVARDAAGNLYVVDSANNTVRKITPDGLVMTLAGLAGASGTNDGLGAVARFKNPFGVAVDSNGNVYVGDNGNNTIRKISPAGAVTTLAGLAGVKGSADGTGSAARFRAPNGVALDSSNNVYVADTGNNTIRKITPAGEVSTFAGSAGNPGSVDKTGSAARFSTPAGVAVDGAGNVYVADSGNATIRKITPAAAVSTLAGSAGATGTNDGTGDTARFTTPFNLTVDSHTNLFVADTFNHIIRKVTTDGVVTTLAGSAGNPGSTNATGTAAQFNFPVGISVDENTNLYVGDFSNDSVRKVSSSLVVTTLAGASGGSGSADGSGSAARFQFPAEIAFDGAGNSYITDLANNTVRKMTPAGVVTTLAGTAGTSGTNDDTGAAARFFNPAGVVVDKDGNILVTEVANHTLRKITPLGVVTTLAGFGGHAGTNDGSGAAARFNSPYGLALDTNGNIFIGDTDNHAIRKVTPDGTVATFAGTITSAGTNDGAGLAAKFNFPEGLAFDGSENLYVIDDGSFTVRRITPDASVTTFAGDPGVSGDSDGPGNEAKFDFPFGAAVDTSGNVFVADTGANTIRKITSGGIVSTIAGLPGHFGSLDGTGSDARFNSPEGIAIDSQGKVYVADAANHSIRKGYPSIPDDPVVDIPAAQTGVARHFSISNLTTTSWSWQLVRRPVGSSTQLSSTNSANPTFIPDVEDLFIVQFQGWDNSGRTTIRLLSIFADNSAPHLTITNPASGQFFSNSVLTVSGTAKDNLQLSNVWVQANNGPWVKATGTTSWAEDVTVVPGTNVVRAYAEDAAGNVSVTNEVGFNHIVSAILSVQINGGGTVSPNLNGAILEIGKTYSMTATASKGSSFVNWTGSLTTNSPTLTFIMQSNLTFTANFTDPISPTIVITSPTSGQRISNSVFTATGTASDNGQIESVSFQLNGGPWLTATNTTNWTAGLNLIPGTNTLKVIGSDTFGNVSTTNTVNFLYIPSGHLTVFVTGSGVVLPNLDGVLLAIGNSYTMTAHANEGSVFSNWVDGVGTQLTATPALTFVMQSNLILRANFTATPFMAAAGLYSGLFFETNNVGTTNSGFFSGKLISSGTFSGKLLMPASSVSISGQFSGGGFFSNSIPRKNGTPLIVQLQLDVAGARKFTGTISDGIWTSTLKADRAVFSTVNPAPQSGKSYTIVFPGSPDGTTAPAGHGFGTFTIAPTGGNFTFKGVLGDGIKVSQKVTISGDGQWPLFFAPYKGQGVMLGWLTFSNAPDSDVSGLINWVRMPGGAVYPNGFNIASGLQAVGSAYSFTSGVPVLNIPAGGTLLLQQGHLPQSVTNNFSLGADNKVTSTNGASVSITSKTGLFKGSALDPSSGKPVPVNGVLLQKLNAGYGLFIGGDETGSAYFGP